MEDALIPVGATNRDQMSLLPMDIELDIGPGTKSSLVPGPMMGRTNAKDQKPFV